MRILIAPQEFKGSLNAAEAAEAIAEGLRGARPDWTFDLLPMADGGPGFIEAMRKPGQIDIAAVAAQDPIGRTVLARYLVARSPHLAIIEAAQANGLLHLQPGERDPLYADTYGVGQIIAAAASGHPPHILIGVGGSATTDGGAGMARALGARFLGEDGRELERGGAPLAGLSRVEWRRPPELDGIEVTVATDVTNPLTGPNGAAAVYGPQKGASPADVDALDAALTRYAMVLRRSLGVDVANVAGAGAAGGLASGLVAFLGATIASGFDAVAEVNNLRERLAAADLVVTGEGSFDNQSRQGKTTGRLIELATAAGKPWVVFAGQADEPGGSVISLASLEPDAAKAMDHASELLAESARNWARKQPA